MWEKKQDAIIKILQHLQADSTLFPSQTQSLLPPAFIGNLTRRGCSVLDWKCRLLVVVVLISIYFSLLDSPLPFSFISSLYPLTPSSLSSTSGTSSWLYPFPPNRPQSRVLLWQNKTKAYIRSSPPLITIHTKHTTQCLTTTGIKKWETSASAANPFEKSRSKSRDYGMILRG